MGNERAPTINVYEIIALEMNDGGSMGKKAVIDGTVALASPFRLYIILESYSLGLNMRFIVTFSISNCGL